MAGDRADIGIRVFLDDAASRGLFAINTQLGQAGIYAKRAGLGFGEMTAQLAGLGVLTGLAVAMVGFGGAIAMATRDAIDFQTLLIRIQRATNANSEEMDKMGNTLMSVGAKSIFSLEEIADGFVLLGQRGISAKDIINGVGQAGVYLAESIGVTPVQAMGLLGATMAAFNLPATQAAKVADLLQFAFEHGVPNVSQLTTAMARLGSIASVMKIPLDQIIPALDVTSRAMGSGATAATGLYYFLNQVASGTPKFKAEIEKLGITFYDANGNFIGLNRSLQVLYNLLKDKSPKEAADIMNQLFAVRSGVSIEILLQDLGKLKGLTKDLAVSHDNMGVAMKRAQEAENSAAGAWKGFMSNLQDVLTLMGGPFLQMVQPVILHLRDLASQLRVYAAQNPQFMGAVLGAAAAFSALGIAIWIATTPLAPFIAIVLGVVAAVAGLAFIFVKVRDNWGSIAGPGTLVNKIFNDITSSMAGLRVIIDQVAGSALKALQGAWDELKPALQQILPILGGIAAIVVGVLIGALSGLAHMVIPLAQAVGVILAGAMRILAGVLNVIIGIVNFFVNAVQGIVAVFQGNPVKAVAFFQKAVEGLGQAFHGVLQIITGAVQAIWGVISGVFGAIIAFIIGFIHGIVSWFQNLANTLVHHSIIPDMIMAIWQWFINLGPNAWHAFSNFVGGLVDRARQLPGMIKNAIGNLAGLLFDAGKNVVQGLLNGIMSVWGNITSWVGNQLNNLRNMFPHSPVKEGPLMDLHTWMPNLVKVLSDTAESSGPSLRSSMSRVAGQVQTGFFSATGGAGGGANGRGEVYNLNVDGKTWISFFHNAITGELQANGVGRLLR